MGAMSAVTAPIYVATKWNIGSFEPGAGLPVIDPGGVLISDQGILDSVVAAAVSVPIELFFSATGADDSPALTPTFLVAEPQSLSTTQQLQAQSNLGISGGGGGGGGGPITSSEITDATTLGLELLTASTATLALGALGAANDVTVPHLTGNESIAGIKTFTGEVIVPTPTAGNDAVTKAYVDGLVQGLSPKVSVHLATAVALPANTYNNGTSGVGATLTATGNGALTVDGVVVSAADRILVKNEATGANNGIYVVTTVGDGSHAYVLTRAVDADAGSELTGAYTFVEDGTANDGFGFVVAISGTITIGTTAITWTKFSGSGSISAGIGLTMVGSVIQLDSNGEVWVIEASGAYPNRPAYLGKVKWYGADQPAGGGTTAGGTAQAVDGLDVWARLS